MAAPKRTVLATRTTKFGLRVRIEEDYGGPMRWVEVTVPFDSLPPDLVIAWQHHLARAQLHAQAELDETLW